MTKVERSNLLSWLYGAIALAALVGCWSQNIHYISPSFFNSNLNFWMDTITTPAARSILIDIVLLFTSVYIWMVIEAKKLGMKHLWAYFVFGLIIGVSFTVPIFLIMREQKLKII